VNDQTAEDSGLGFFAAVLPTSELRTGQSIQFTLRWTENGAWLDRDVHLVVS
jgi:hypothetical protein